MLAGFGGNIRLKAGSPWVADTGRVVAEALAIAAGRTHRRRSISERRGCTPTPACICRAIVQSCRERSTEDRAEEPGRRHALPLARALPPDDI